MKRTGWVSVAGYGTLVAIIFGPALFPPDGFMIFGDDIHRQYYFFRQFFNEWMGKGIFPWWNPYLFGGEPFIANPVVNIWYPINWLFVVLPLNVAYSWHLAFHVFWAMLGMYKLSSQFMVHSSQKGKKGLDGAAWVSGVIFGLSGFFMARTFAGHVDVIAAASWMPWVVWAFWRLARVEVGDAAPGDRNFFDRVHQALRSVHFAPGDKNFLGTAIRFHPAKILSPVASLHSETPLRAKNYLPARLLAQASIVFALQLLAGYQTMAFMTVIVVGFVTSLHCYIEKSWKPFLRVGLAGLGGLGLAAFHLLPEQELFRAGIRTYGFPYAWHSYGSIEWRSLLQFLNPFQFGNQYTYNGPPPNFIEHSSFVGIGGLVLALVGIIQALRSVHFAPALRSVFRVLASSRSRSFFLHTVMGVKAMTMLRSETPLRAARSSAKILSPVASSQKNTPPSAFFLSMIFIVVFGLWVSLGPNAPIDLQYILWKFVPMYQYLRIPARHLIIVVFGLAGLAGVGFSSLRLPKSLTLLMMGIITLEIVWFGRGFIELKPIPETRHDKELIAILRQDDQPYRVIQNFGVWVGERDVLDFDSVLSYGIFSATGYDPSIIRSYYEFTSGGNGKKAVLSHDVQIPYVTDPAILDRLNVKYIMVPKVYDPFLGNSRYLLIRDTTQRVYENTTVKSRFFSTCGTVTVTSYTPNRIELLVDTICDGPLESSEVWYPGWEAFIDGKKSDVTKSEDTFRTLFVPAGKHSIVYQYNPKIFVYGALLSVLTATILLRMVFMKRKPLRL